MSELTILEKAISLWGEPVSTSGEEAKFMCPECSKRALYFNFIKGIANCFVCGFGKGLNSFRVDPKTINTSKHELDSDLHRLVANKIIEITQISDIHRDYLRLRGIYNPDTFKITTCPFQAHKILRQYFSSEELLKSGFCNNTIEFWPSLGISSKRILIPYWEGESFSTLKSRLDPYSIDPELPRYISIKGSEIGERVFYFGPRKKVKDLIITEGELKAISALDSGIEAIAIPGISFPKGKIISKLKELSSFAERVFIIFDSDENYEDKKPLLKGVCSINRVIQNSVICFLPQEGKEKIDLDGFLGKNGVESLEDILEDSWKERESLNLYWNNKTHGK